MTAEETQKLRRLYSKRAKRKAKIALNMDRGRDHFLHEQFCFFDGKRKRCRGFVTLTASVYHPLIRKQITLAVMESESETQKMLLCFGNFSTKFLQKCLKTKQGSLILLGGGQTWQKYLMCLARKLKAALRCASSTSRNIETK